MLDIREHLINHWLVDAFSYLSVLLSIILGLGLTQVLTACGRLIRHRDRVRFDWLPLLWAAILFVLYVQVWWSMFGLRGVHAWTFGAFLIVLLQTATLYLMAAVVLPEQVGDAGIDLRVHYDDQHRWFFACFVATLVVSLLKDVIIGGGLPSRANLVFHIVLIATCLSAFIIRARRYHALIAVTSAGAMFAYIALLFATLR